MLLIPGGIFYLKVVFSDMIKILQETNGDKAMAVLKCIPELDGPINKRLFEDRLKNNPIILLAYAEEEAVGVKIGYKRWNDGSFYSWLGGVLPEYRNQGIAQMLNQKMEELAKEKGFNSIVFKTRNKFKSMLLFGLKNGYQVVDFQEKENISENRIILKKQL